MHVLNSLSCIDIMLKVFHYHHYHYLRRTNSYWIVLLALTIIIFSGTAAPTCRSSSKLEKAVPGTSAIAACKQSHRLLTSRKIMVLLFIYHTGIIMLS